MKRVLLGLMLSTLSLSSWAVDGYKGVKFGSSIDDVINSKLCTYKKIENSVYNIKEVSSYVCYDLNFSGKKTTAIFTFIDNKFQRISIDVDPDTAYLMEALQHKYGRPSSRPDQDQIALSKTTGIPVSFGFDDDTIFVAKRYTNGNSSALLIYTTSHYEEKIRQLSTSNLSQDI
ncbi:hypothetical protein [Photorhabdus cinerea]|uniref:Uncharacterized protein n=1 Tax=Photorhabdus cinerea TaxID=471575 RepID=A0A7X5QAI6_9GAMM|nr:hypothetical protein [Photorhabdus cinerea]NHB90771.1 hypothetical protein [Photorhabdus cinerea]